MSIQNRTGKNDNNIDCLSRAPITVITFMSFQVSDSVEIQNQIVLKNTARKHPRANYSDLKRARQKTIQTFPTHWIISNICRINSYSRGQTIVPKQTRI